ncbi:MAG: hypothetical protein ABJE66_22550 [Deltaproteobacteria bacterium]
MADARRADAPELRCVAPLVVLGAEGPVLAGPCMLVTNGAHTIAVASAEVLRRAGEPLAILTRLDGSTHVAVKAWQLARHASLGIVDLGEGVAFTPDVHPLHLGSLSAAIETRGAPAALVTFAQHGGRFDRATIGVKLVVDDGGGMSDDISRLAIPLEAAPALLADGAPLFAWMPPDPVLGRGSEVIAVAIGVTPRAKVYQPQPQPPLAELAPLEDIGRVLPWADLTPPPQSTLGLVAGEIGEITAPVAKPRE